jgi:hypothetical protein
LHLKQASFSSAPGLEPCTGAWIPGFKPWPWDAWLCDHGDISYLLFPSLLQIKQE